MAKRQTETLLNMDNKSGVVEITQLLENLNVEEQKEMLLFVQGMIFAKTCFKENEKVRGQLK